MTNTFDDSTISSTCWYRTRSCKTPVSDDWLAIAGQSWRDHAGPRGVNDSAGHPFAGANQSERMIELPMTNSKSVMRRQWNTIETHWFVHCCFFFFIRFRFSFLRTIHSQHTTSKLINRIEATDDAWLDFCSWASFASADCVTKFVGICHVDRERSRVDR